MQVYDSGFVRYEGNFVEWPYLGTVNRHVVPTLRNA